MNYGISSIRIPTAQEYAALLTQRDRLRTVLACLLAETDQHATGDCEALLSACTAARAVFNQTEPAIIPTLNPITRRVRTFGKV